MDGPLIPAERPVGGTDVVRRIAEREDRRRRNRRRAWGCSIAGVPVLGIVILFALFSSFVNGCHIFSPPPCESGSNELVQAATSGDLSAVRDHLNSGEAADGSGSPVRPLDCAIQYAHADVAVELLGHGAAATHPDDLVLAATSGQVSVVRALLEHGASASPDAVDKLAGSDYCVGGLGFSFGPEAPARNRHASEEDAATIIGLMLDHGVDPSGQPGKPSPLLWATFSGKPAIAKVLLDRGASIDHGGHVDRLELQGAAAEAQGGSCVDGMSYPWTGYEALRAGDTVASGSSSDSSRPRGTSAPATAITGVTLLPLFPVEYAPANGVDNVTPLTAAALKGNLGMATMLLDHGADANAVSGGLVSPLYSAAVRGDDAMVRSLSDIMVIAALQ